tara:strand:- start:72 stop:395 length:324 start_codon:yes stop_codon:yes gene_type:complete
MVNNITMGGDFSKLIDITVKVFEFIGLLIDNLIDAVLGTIVLIWGVAEQAINLLPLILDITDYVLQFVDYLIDVFTEYWRVPAVIMTLVPLYVLMFFLINRINSILD